jgi:CheY-like chemotaxis protein
VHGTILLVEDDKEIREPLQDLLEKQGYAVLTAADGRAALDILRSADRPDVILLDLLLPIMQGRQVLEVIRANDRLKTIPVIAVSAWPNARSIASQADCVLLKPFSITKLLESVAAYCDQTQASKLLRSAVAPP